MGSKGYLNLTKWVRGVHWVCMWLQSDHEWLRAESISCNWCLAWNVTNSWEIESIWVLWASLSIMRPVHEVFQDIIPVSYFTWNEFKGGFFQGEKKKRDRNRASNYCLVAKSWQTLRPLWTAAHQAPLQDFWAVRKLMGCYSLSRDLPI